MIIRTSKTIFYPILYLFVIMSIIAIMSIKYHLGVIGLVIFIRTSIVSYKALKTYKLNNIKINKDSIEINKTYPNKEQFILNKKDIKNVQVMENFIKKRNVKIETKNNSIYLFENIKHIQNLENKFSK